MRRTTSDPTSDPGDSMMIIRCLQYYSYLKTCHPICLRPLSFAHLDQLMHFVTYESEIDRASKLAFRRQAKLFSLSQRMQLKLLDNLTNVYGQKSLRQMYNAQFWQEFNLYQNLWSFEKNYLIHSDQLLKNELSSRSKHKTHQQQKCAAVALFMPDQLTFDTGGKRSSFS